MKATLKKQFLNEITSEGTVRIFEISNQNYIDWLEKQIIKAKQESKEQIILNKIDIKEQLPKNEDVYIVWFNGIVTTAYWTNGGFYELNFDQSPDFISVDYFAYLPKQQTNKQ